MPIREPVRIDLPAANQTADGQISARAFPWTAWPRGDNQCAAWAIDTINLSPATSIIRMLWQNMGSELYDYPGNTLNFLGEIVENGMATLTFYNLNIQAGVTIMLTVLSFRYNEPRWRAGAF